MQLHSHIPALVVICAVITYAVSRSATAMVDVLQKPDRVHVVAESGTADAADSDLAHVTTVQSADGLHVQLAAPAAAIKRIELHWSGAIDPQTRCLGDAWERSYADLGWKPLAESGAMPWYFLTAPGNRTDGYGVMTAPASMCCWKADATGLTLIADVRSGGVGVQLGDRTLDVCTVVNRDGKDGEQPFDAAVALCRQMCPHPRLPKMPVYGYNDWNSTYGHNTADHFISDAGALAALAPAGPNRPFMVVDDGWQANRQGGKSAGNPWDRTNARFGSTMPELAKRVKQLNGHPGLWYRPLEAWPNAAKGELLRGKKDIFDPSVPAVQERIAQDMRRFHEWGFEFVKHDYSSVEILGKWGKELGDHGSDDGWAFADRTHTTAEIILQLYRVIRQGGGDEMTIDGCNTISHLSAGMFELCRIGDDTSGTDWNRTRDYGVNTLAFRSAQQGTFYAVDPDMVGLVTAGAVPWEKNRQWLDLVARSGTTLIVSWKTSLLSDEVKDAIRAAYAAAAAAQPVAHPLDGMDAKVPTRWLIDGREQTFNW